MAVDAPPATIESAPPPAPVPQVPTPAVEPPVAAVTAPPVPEAQSAAAAPPVRPAISPDSVRSGLRDAIRARSRGSVVASPQQAETAQPPASAEPPKAAASEAPPASAAPAPAEPPKAEAAPSAPTAPPETPAPPAPAPPKAEAPSLPPEFGTREYQSRFERDPHLRRELLGIWRQPGLSEVAKTVAMQRRVSASDQRIAEAQASQERIRNLRTSGDLEAWAAEQEKSEAFQAQQRQWAQGVTQILARALQVDVDDPAFLGAGSIEPGEPEDLRAVRFAEWAVEHSPLGRALVARIAAEKDTSHGSTLDSAKAAHQAELDALRAGHDEQIKTLNREWEQRLEAARAESLANGRGTNVRFPPRSGAGIPVEGQPRPMPRSTTDVRDLIREGLRIRRDASHAVPE